MTPWKRTVIAYGFPILAFAATGVRYLIRQLWFDEALTILNFACLDSPAAIYRNYAIPNNHLLFTALIHYWMKIPQSAFPLDVWLRIPSALLALGFLAFMAWRFRALCGAVPLGITLTALALSPAFQNYATAVRGYMLGTFLTALALGAAMDCVNAVSWRPWFWYALASLGAVAAVPSNLAGLAGAVLFTVPMFGRRFWKKRRFYLLALVPPAMLAAVYLPIFPQFKAAAALGEGWQDRWASLRCLYASVAVAFAMLILPAVAGSLGWFLRFRRRWLSLARGAIWLLPIPAAFIFKAAPFPRVYFPLFPLFALLIARAVRELMPLDTRWRRKRYEIRLWSSAMLLLVIMWGVFPLRSPDFLLRMSQRFGGDLGDDFMYGYYLRPEHTPLSVADRLLDMKARNVYLSFLSDPWSVMFYHLLRGGRAEYLFDGPRGAVKELPAASVAVLRADEDPAEIERRFGVKLRRTAELPACSVFVVEKI